MSDSNRLDVSTVLRPDEIDAWEATPSLSRVGRLYTSVAWAELAHRDDGIPTTFFRLYEGDRLVAGCMGDLMPAGVPDHYDLDGLLRGNSVTGELPPWLDPQTSMPCMTITTRAGRAADMRVVAAPEERQVQWVTALIEGVRDWGRDNGSRTSAILFAPHDSIVIQRAASAAGYARGAAAENFYLEIDFPDFEGYLAAFGSHRRRCMRRERHRALADPDVTFTYRTLAEGIDEFVDLAVLNALKYGNENMAQADRLRARAQVIVDCYGDHARVVEMRLRDKVIGTAQFIEHDGIYYARAVGIVPDLPPRLAVYFNIGYYELIDLALAEGARRIVYAHQLGETKLSHGCRAEVQDLWVDASHTAAVDRLQIVDEYAPLLSREDIAE